jgi:SAM-dependent methyltransferase
MDLVDPNQYQLGISSKHLTNSLLLACHIHWTLPVFASFAACRICNSPPTVCLDLVDPTKRQQAISSGQLPASFNLILAHMVLHHVEDAAAVVACLSGLLQRGGRLVLTDLLQTERSKAFHGAAAHHTVSHAGESCVDMP